MIYRDIGKTGRRCSVIGLGCENLDGKPFEQVRETVDAALEQGINILDVFMPGREVRENIAKALGSRRSQVMLQGHIGSTEKNGQYNISRDLPEVKRHFEELLRLFGGYIQEKKASRTGLDQHNPPEEKSPGGYCYTPFPYVSRVSNMASRFSFFAFSSEPLRSKI